MHESSGNALLDDVLQSPGLSVGLLNLVADANVYDCDAGTQDAVNILDKRDISGNNKKKASDAAYGLAAQLLAALANEAAGDGVCSEAGQAIIDGQTLLAGIGFDGTGDYYGGKGKNATDEMAARLRPWRARLASTAAQRMPARRCRWCSRATAVPAWAQITRALAGRSVFRVCSSQSTRGSKDSQLSSM